MDLKVSSTIGYERRHNELFAETDEERFVERATAKLPPQPPNFQAVVDLNRGPLLTAGVEVMPLAPRQVEQKRAEGALLVDVRTDLQFDEAHIPGSVCITMLQRRLRHEAGLGRRPRPGGRADRARRRGRAAGGAARGRGRHPQPRRLPRRRHDELARGAPRGRRASSASRWRSCAREREADPALQILDVRERAEWEQRHIPGSLHVPYHDIGGVPEGIDPRTAGRGDLLVGPAERRRREPAAAARARRRDPRRRRRGRHLGAAGLPGRRSDPATKEEVLS